MRGRKKQTSIDLKIKAIKSYKKSGDADKIAEALGVTKRTLYIWLNEYDSGNLKKNRKIVDGRGRPTKLPSDKAKNLLSIVKKPASEYGFENDLWNTSRLRIVCKKELKLNLSRMAIWRTLNKFEYSFKKVQKEYYETNKTAQEKWKKTTLPKIKRTIKKHRAILYFEDESCIQLSPVMGKSWGPIGEKIIHKVTGNRGSISAISSISSDGRLVFNVHDGGKRFNSGDIIDFLGQMLDHHKRRHLVVIMDRATCHTSKKTCKYINGQKRLHVFYLPSRSPKFNPDEQVWAHLKHHELKSHQESNLDGLKKLAHKKLKNLSTSPKKLRGIFKRCDNAHLFC